MFKKFIDRSISIIDFFLLILCIVMLMELIAYVIINIFNLCYSNYSYMLNMVDTPTSVNVNIIRENGWSEAVRTLIIYASGYARLHLVRNGTPSTKAFIVGGTIAADSASKVVGNIISDPSYVASHYKYWQLMWENTSEGVVKVDVSKDSETLEKFNSTVNPFNSFTSNGNSLDSIDTIIEKFMTNVLNFLKYFVAPQPTPFTPEVLANQIHQLSIVLFVLAIAIFILISILLINIIVVINNQLILNYFKNKWIKWYISITIKFIALEVFLTGSSVLYFLSVLIQGLQYIAQHPITIN